MVLVKYGKRYYCYKGSMQYVMNQFSKFLTIPYYRTHNIFIFKDGSTVVFRPMGVKELTKRFRRKL